MHLRPRAFDGGAFDQSPLQLAEREDDHGVVLHLIEELSKPRERVPILYDQRQGDSE